MTTPKPKKRTTKITYWLCGAPKCRTHHTTEALAIQCPKLRRTPRAEIQKAAEQRRREVFKLRDGGMTYKEIAERLGITASRARQLYDEGERLVLGWDAYAEKHWPGYHEKAQAREAAAKERERERIEMMLPPPPKYLPKQLTTIEPERKAQLDELFNSKLVHPIDSMRTYLYAADLPLDEISRHIDAVFAVRNSHRSA